MVAIKLRGRVEKGRIVTEEMPFTEGQEVEIVLLENPDPVVEMAKTDRRKAFDLWTEELRRIRRDSPVLSDEAMSRDSIYEDRGL